jgi:hypothetical protein
MAHQWGLGLNLDLYSTYLWGKHNCSSLGAVSLVKLVDHTKFVLPLVELVDFSRLILSLVDERELS